MLKAAIVMRMTKIPFVSMFLFLCQMYNVPEFQLKPSSECGVQVPV